MSPAKAGRITPPNASRISRRFAPVKFCGAYEAGFTYYTLQRIPVKRNCFWKKIPLTKPTPCDIVFYTKEAFK
jgi:hypothetical protein